MQDGIIPVVNNKINLFLSTSAAGGVVAPTEIYGSFLTNNGLWLLSYAEWMKVIGSLYISMMIIGLLIKTVSYIRCSFKKKLSKENSNVVDMKKHDDRFKRSLDGQKISRYKIR